jgi:hypothetical protein
MKENNIGIYLIECLKTNKVYIGSAKNLERRKKEHFSSLLKNKHNNKFLQNAWNKYGSDKFKFIILEFCNDDILLKREQYYIDKEHQNLYNICPVAGNTFGVKQSQEHILKKSKDYVFVSPENKIYRVTGMRQFCREMDLPQSHMISISSRKERQYEGWIVYKNEIFSEKLLEKIEI